jgi:hypothetical protein
MSDLATDISQRGSWGIRKSAQWLEQPESFSNGQSVSTKTLLLLKKEEVSVSDLHFDGFKEWDQKIYQDTKLQNGIFLVHTLIYHMLYECMHTLTVGTPDKVGGFKHTWGFSEQSMKNLGNVSSKEV